MIPRGVWQDEGSVRIRVYVHRCMCVSGGGLGVFSGMWVCECVSGCVGVWTRCVCTRASQGGGSAHLSVCLGTCASVTPCLGGSDPGISQVSHGFPCTTAAAVARPWHRESIRP